MEAERVQVEEHVAICDSCCELLKSLPPDPLAARLRDGDTSDLIGETLGPAGSAHTTFAAGIPPELADHPRYRIVEQLGTGGMGAVYLAEHRLMERRVAVKVIHPQFVQNSQAVERFEQEVKAAARLSHRNIVTAFDAEQAGGLHLLVMEYVPGINLATLIDRRGRLPVLHACNYAMQAAVGLQHAHQHGMVHRDIKPQNLMRTPRGTIKILDFGLARLARSPSEAEDAGLTSAGCAMGTPDYIAPEQARDSRHADIRSDIYSLGCTLYFLLTGRVPFPGGTGLEKVVAHLQQTPLSVARQRDDVPPSVVKVLQRMMAKDRSERYQEPGEVVEALRPFALPGETAAAPQGGIALEPIAPLMDVDPLGALAAAAPVISRHRSRPTPSWQRLWMRHRLALVSSGAALVALALALFVLPPLMRGSRGALKQDLPHQAGSNQREQTIVPVVPIPADRQWTDLLPRIDPATNAVAGDWHKVGAELRVYPAPNAKIVILVQPPAEYDFEVEFTRHRGTQSIPLFFVAGGRQATFEIDAWDAGLGGIQNVGNLELRSENNPTRVTDQRITNGRRTTMSVSVRRDRVEGYVDGRLIATYRGNGSDLSLLDVWDLGQPGVLGVGSYLSETTFHRIRMRTR
jgi:serine/threonine protein kinase